MSIPRALTAAALLAATLAACADQPTEPQSPGPEPKPAPVALGVYEVVITGADGSAAGVAASRAAAVPSGPSEALNPALTGLVLETVSTTTFVEGTRSTRGQRFVVATFRVRNSSGAPVSNVTFLPVIRSSAPVTIAGTPFSTLLLFNGSSAPQAIASQIVPAGAVNLGEDGRLRGTYADVLQVFTEAEVAAIAPPAGISSILPYGYVARNPGTPNSRTLPNAANDNDFSGLVTFAFRYPLQATASGDPFTIGIQFLAVQDTETRMTESIEERQDTSGVRRLRERATALGATTVTVLAGSPAVDPFVTDYPGQRQICSVRTAGTAASPVTFITRQGPYTELPIYRGGESPNACGAYFSQGITRPAYYGIPYTATMRAMDRYGNVDTLAIDTVSLTSTDGTAVIAPPAALTNGVRGLSVTYTTYGLSTLRSAGRRMRGSATVLTNGNVRRWTGNVNNSWFVAGDWTTVVDPVAGVPGAQDSVVIPGDRPNYPLFVQNMSAYNVVMEDGTTTQPTINISSFDFTITGNEGNLLLGNNGTITGPGRVILAGTTGTFGGGLSNVDFRNLRVTGRYSTTSNVNVTGGRIVVQGGRLRSEGKRIRVRPS